MNFKGTKWQKEIDVRDFMLENMTPYDGDEHFLVGSSKKTKELWDKCQKLITKERNSFGGVPDYCQRYWFSLWFSGTSNCSCPKFNRHYDDSWLWLLWRILLFNNDFFS